MKKRKCMCINTIYACTSVIYKISEGKCPGMSVIACSSSGMMNAWLAEGVSAHWWTVGTLLTVSNPEMPVGWMLFDGRLTALLIHWSKKVQSRFCCHTQRLGQSRGFQAKPGRNRPTLPQRILFVRQPQHLNGSLISVPPSRRVVLAKLTFKLLLR
jgi:hypothetical protein